MTLTGELSSRIIKKRCGPSPDQTPVIFAVSTENRTFSLKNDLPSRYRIGETDRQTTIYRANTDQEFSFRTLYGECSHSQIDNEKKILEINGEKISNLARLESIASLPDNWNGNGAKVFSKGLIVKVKKLILSLERQPEIFPTACDTLQLEYEREDPKGLSVERGCNRSEQTVVEKMRRSSTISVLLIVPKF